MILPYTSKGEVRPLELKYKTRKMVFDDYS
jgi:hypothetical protein